MSEEVYQLVAVPVVGEPFTLAGVEVTISEVNELILFRVPEDTPDSTLAELQEIISEAFQDQNPNRVIIARGPVSLRLERIEKVIPDKKAKASDRSQMSRQERIRWLREEIYRLTMELVQLEAAEGKFGTVLPFGKWEMNKSPGTWKSISSYPSPEIEITIQRDPFVWYDSGDKYKVSLRR